MIPPSDQEIEIIESALLHLFPGYTVMPVRALAVLNSARMTDEKREIGKVRYGIRTYKVLEEVTLNRGLMITNFPDIRVLYGVGEANKSLFYIIHKGG